MVRLAACESDSLGLVRVQHPRRTVLIFDTHEERFGFETKISHENQNRNFRDRETIGNLFLGFSKFLLDS